MKRVLCIAGSCCDLIFGGLPKLPALGEEIYGSHFSMQAGGGANTAVQLARCGVPTDFWTLLGDDLPGQIVRETLIKSRLNLVSHGQTAARTPVSAVLSTRTDRALASFGEEGPLIENMDALTEAIKAADIVHTFLGYCEAFPIPALCERFGAILSVDTSFCDARSELFETVLPHCDYWKGNETEAKKLTGASDVFEALKLLSDRVKQGAVITRGEQGSIGATHGGAIIEQPVIVCGAFVDACGAGDAYAAGFLSGLAQDEPFSACMQRGAALAGRVVTGFGGCPETPINSCE